MANITKKHSNSKESCSMRRRSPAKRKGPKPRGFSANVRHLAEAFAAGEDCAFALHDALCEDGQPELAEHFHPTKKLPCHHGEFCLVIDRILHGRVLPAPVEIPPSQPEEPQVPGLCYALEKNGVAYVEADYDGAGDSGGVERTRFLKADGTELPPTDSLRGLEDTVADLCYECLPGGWEINEGSYGTFKIDVLNRKCSADHNHRFTESSCEELEW